MNKKTGKAITLTVAIPPEKAGEAVDAKTGALLELTRQVASKSSKSLGVVKVAPKLEISAGTGSAGPASAGASASQTAKTPVVTTDSSKRECILKDLIFHCQHKKRKCNDQHVLWVVGDIDGDLIHIEPKVENGTPACIRYEITDPDGGIAHFKESSRKIRGWYAKPGATGFFEALGRPLLWSVEPQIWTLRAIGNNGYLDGTIRSYPADKLELQFGLKELADKLTAALGPLADKLSGWAGSNLNLLEKNSRGSSLGGGFYLIIDEPKVQFAVSAQWAEYPPSHEEWWRAYCRWKVSLRGNPMISVKVRLDLAEVGLNAAAPGLGVVWASLMDRLKHPPPFYAELFGKLQGEIGIEEKKPDQPIPFGKIEGKIGVAIGLEVKAGVVEADCRGETSVGAEIGMSLGGGQAAQIYGDLKWNGVIGKVKIKLKTGEWLSWVGVKEVAMEKEFVFFEGGKTRLIETNILPG
jgi:hypothetical protein